MNALVPSDTLHGEVLPDTVRVMWLPKVVDETVREVHHLPAGATLEEIVEDVAPGYKVKVWSDGWLIQKADWPHVFPARDVTIRHVPGPFLLPLIPILAATLSTAAGLTIGGLTVATTAAIIGAAASVLVAGIGMLFRPSAPQLQQSNQQQASPTYSISGFQNQILRFGVVPNISGRHRVYPPYAAQPNTELVGSDQYIKALFIVSQGFINISDMKIGETPISAFSDFQVVPFFVPAGGNFPTGIGNFANEVALSVDLGTVNAPPPSQTRTSAPNSNAVSLDFVAPEGIWAAYPSGQIVTWYHRLRIERRLVGAANWTTVYAAYQMIGSIRGEVVRVGVYMENPGAGQYEFRVTTLPDVYDSRNVYADRVVWTAIRSHFWIKPTNVSYPATYVYIRGRASEQLSGQIDSFNLIAQRAGYQYLGGGAWTASGAQTHNPAAGFREILQGPGNARAVTDSGINFFDLNAFAEDCNANGWIYNRVHDYEGDVYSALRDCCAAGRGEPAFVNGQWTVIWERSTLTPIVQAFSPRNTMSFSGQRSFLPQLHGLRARFVNELAGYEQDERVIYADGYGPGNALPGRIEGVEFPGVTHPDAIWRLGRYQIAQQQLRRELYTVEVDIEHILCQRGDRVRVNHDVPKWGQIFGRVLTISGSVLTLDEPVIMEPGVNYTMGFRTVDGAGGHADLVWPVLNVPGEQDQVTLIGATFLPSPGDMFFFGEATRESVVLRVYSITPTSDNAARLELVDDAPQVLNAALGAIPPFNTNISEPASLDPLQFAPSGLIMSSSPTEKDGQPLEVLRISFVPPNLPKIAKHEVQYRLAFESQWRVQALDASARELVVEVPSGEWQARVRTHLSGPVGRSNVIVSGWSPILTFSARSSFATPPDVTGLRLVLLGERVTLYWDDLPGLAAGVEIRHSRATSDVTVSTARVVAENVRGGSATVPALSGTYLLRWKTVAGIYSATPTTLVTTAPDLANFNIVEEIEEHPGFAGAKSGVSVIGGELSREGVGTGIYYFNDSVDLGGVYGALLEFVAVANGEDTSISVWDRADIWNAPAWDVPPGDWGLEIEYRVTSDDPSDPSPEWSEWRLLDLGEVSGRAFEFRALLTSFRENVAVRVNELTAIVDMPDRTIEVARKLTIPVAGQTFIYDGAFLERPLIGLTTYDAPQGSYYSITNDDETGFLVRFYNAAGAQIAVTADITAKGYGKAQAA